jgi:hypothetical protein
MLNPSIATAEIPSIWKYAETPRTPAERVEELMQGRGNPMAVQFQRLKSFTKRYSMPEPSTSDQSWLIRNPSHVVVDPCTTVGQPRRRLLLLQACSSLHTPHIRMSGPRLRRACEVLKGQNRYSGVHVLCTNVHALIQGY